MATVEPLVTPDYETLLRQMVVEGIQEPSALLELPSVAAELGIDSIGIDCFAEAVGFDELLAAGLAALELGETDDLRGEIVAVLMARLIEGMDIPEEAAAKLIGACKLVLASLDMPRSGQDCG